MNKRAAIELSANFLVIIIISIVILAAGITLFFKLKGNAQAYVDKLDSQTEDRIKSMMLSSDQRVIVYPGSISLSPNDAKLVGLGIMNINTDDRKFTVDITVKHYATADATSDSPSGTFYDIAPGDISIPANTQVVKGILLRMPKDASKGEYVYTITVTDITTLPETSYGVVQVYAQN
jgi:hypothetical protein